MSQTPDPMDELLRPHLSPALSPTWKEALLVQTKRRLRWRRRGRLFGFAAVLAACYIAGVLTMRLFPAEPVVEFRTEYVYLPAESDTGMFGGNSNWRGPIWMPVNGLIVRALLQYYAYYGDDFTIECPTGSGRQMNLYQVAEEISGRLASIFLRNSDGQRPVYGGTTKFQTDPHWRDLVLFYEYFHGDNGAGLGASHQTGWTGIIARMMHLFATTTSQQVLELGKQSAVTAVESV